MRVPLMLFFAAILAGMLWVTTAASLEQDLWSAVEELWPDGWFRATLADAYFGFLTVFVWIAWREASVGRSAVWFVALMLLGNIAIAVYFLVALARLEGPGIDGLFRRRRGAEAADA